MTTTRKHSKLKSKKTVFGVCLALLTPVAGTIGKTMWDRFIAPFDLEVDAQYIDAAGVNHPAAGAVLDLPVVSTEKTDEGGRAYWKNVVPHWTEKKVIVVDPPYAIVSAPPVFLRRYSNPVNVLLRKIETEEAAATPPAPPPPATTSPAPAPPPEAQSPAEPGSQPASQPSPQERPQPPAQAAGPPGRSNTSPRRAAALRIHGPIGQEAEHVQLTARAVEAAKPPTAVKPAAVTASALPDVTDIYRSGPQISGVGKNFSQPYDLCSGPPPAGYVIKSNRFMLAGDRQCGRWATCTETRNEATKVCWQFSLEGHEEQTGIFKPGESGQAYTEGVLSVVWTRATK